MELQRFADVASFYGRSEPFLLQREAEHNLILGICAVLKYRPDTYGDGPPYFATVEDGGVVLAAAVRTPPHNLVLSHLAGIDALDLFAGDLHGPGQGLPGVVGPSTVSRAFAERWRRLTGKPSRRAMAMRIYELTTVNPVHGLDGHLRRATAADRALLLEWYESFQRGVFGQADREGLIRSIDQHLAADPQIRGLYVWEDGAPVSMAGYTGPTPHGIRIGPVYTPPEHRRRGYASACVAAVSRRLLDSGRRFCFLFTDLANPTSNQIYQAIGYEPVGDVDEYRFD